MQPGRWIRQQRKRRGLSQAKLAKLLDLPQARLSEWELGKAAASSESLDRIRAALADLGRFVESGKLRVRKRRWRDEFGGGAVVARPLPALSGVASHSAVGSAGPDAQWKAIALFAGCGGMSLGFRSAGFSVPGFVELNDAARATYSANFPGSVCLGTDVRSVSAAEVGRWSAEFGRISVLFGGPPCQGFSLAGKRDPHDDRNRLYVEFARIAALLRPDCVVLENVRVLTSMRSPSSTALTADVLRAFAGAGYRCRFQALNAKDYGAPQFRERVFFLGVRDDMGVDATFPPKTHGLAPPLAPYRTFRDATGDLEPLESGERSPSDPYHWAVHHPPHVIEWLRNVPEGASAHQNEDPRLRPSSGYNTTYKRLRWDEPCSTVGTTFGMISGSRNVHPVHTRSLTVREALRCQTFPDDFRLSGAWGEIRTMIGNAVPPLLAEAIGAHLLRTVLAPLAERSCRQGG